MEDFCNSAKMIPNDHVVLSEMESKSTGDDLTIESYQGTHLSIKVDFYQCLIFQAPLSYAVDNVDFPILNKSCFVW